MSTILKALKQVDQTAPPEDSQTWPPQIDTKKTIRTRVEKIRLDRKISITIFLLLIIVAAGWLVYTQKDRLLAKLPSDRALEKDQLSSTAAPPKAPIYKAKIHPTASKRPAKPAKKDFPSNRGNQRAGLKYSPKQPVSDKRPQPFAQTPVQKNIAKNERVSVPINPGSTPKPVPSKSQISRSQIVDPKKPVRNQSRASVPPSTKKIKSTPKPASRSYQRLKDSKLKLQAIAWSDDPAQRIAVINNHVVREGESVEGFSVTQIRPDDIIVNDGSESWRLEFGLK